MISISILKKNFRFVINVGTTSSFIIMKFSLLLAALIFSSAESTFIPCTTVCINPLSSTQCTTNNLQSIDGFGNVGTIINPLSLNQQQIGATSFTALSANPLTANQILLNDFSNLRNGLNGVTNSQRLNLQSLQQNAPNSAIIVGNSNVAAGTGHMVSGNQNAAYGLDLSILGNGNAAKGSNSTIIGN